MKKEDLYDINTYSEKELYEVLDLDEPTDRELEAKILMMIHKYEQMGSSAGKKLVSFFEKVYDHFFESEEEEVVEGFENEIISADKVGEILDLEKDEKANWVKIPDEEITWEVEKDEEKNKIIQKGEEEKEGETVIYTKELEYGKGIVNPLLKQTTQRIISIDSQYRTDKTAMPTEFTFNLSEPLKDVVSLRLYSVQIPYTWYTIGKSFGSNFFLFKGKTAGINNETHDIKIEIDAGNYNSENLSTSINASIQEVNNTIDATIKNSYLNYNNITTKSTLIIDIDKDYNESSYRLSFPTWDSPYNIYDSSKNTIASYLGFETKEYDFNVLKSPLYYEMPVAPTVDTTSFTIDDDNNTIIINQYYGTMPFTNGVSTIDVSANIQLTNGVYTRTSLISHLNSKLIENTMLYESYIERKNIDAGNNEFKSPKKSYNELKVKFKRTVMNPQLDSKTVVILPDESKVWIGATSCFRFDSSYNELSYIYGDTLPVVQNDRYKIEDKPYILLKSIVPGFESVNNDISINLIDSPADGYSITEYISKINESIRDAETTYNILNNNNSAIKFNINAPLSTYTFDSSTDTNPEGTYAYLKDNIFNLYLDVSKEFNEQAYEIDITGTIFGSEGVLKLKNESGDIVGDTLSDLTKTYGATIGSNASFTIDSAKEKICTIKSKSNNNGNSGEEYDIKINQGAYLTYVGLQDAINDSFENYVDSYSNIKIFEGTELSFILNAQTYDISFNIQINKKLIGKNYNIQFIDTNTTNDSWEKYLKIDTLMTDASYDLSYNMPSVLTNNNGIELANILSTGEITIKATDNVEVSNPLTIQSGINDTIKFYAYENGVYSVNDENTVDIVIPAGIYSREFLINKINETILTSNNLIHKNNTKMDIVQRDGNDYVRLYGNFKRKYRETDYNLVFYDKISFAKCFVGAKSVQNTTWDTTVGWILGYRLFTTYDISLFYNFLNDRYQIEGDTGVNTDLFNYFLLCLDDYNQNHLNDGLITVTGEDNTLPLPSYANRSEFQCDPVTGEFTYNNTTGLTEKQIYAANEIRNERTNVSFGTSVSTESYGVGPYVSNVFGLIPLKVGNLSAGSSYVEFGGTLQNQERSYFGPVNIQRMTVKLVSDRGNIVDLNNANWSFSLICEQLNKLEPNK